MDIRSVAFGTGILLLAITGAVLILDPSEAAKDPETRFNVEVSSYADGNAEFVYTPTNNQTNDVFISYNISVGDIQRESVNNRRIDGVSKNQPVKVLVEAEKGQHVQVRMNITDLEGNQLHQSHHSIGPAEN